MDEASGVRSSRGHDSGLSDTCLWFSFPVELDKG